MKIINIITFIFLATTSLLSQEAFNRAYFNDGREMLGFEVAQTADDAYLLLSSTSENDTALVNVTKVNPKGDVLWSKDYGFEGIQNFNIDDFKLLEKDSFVFSLAFREVGLNKIWCKAAPNGDIIWSNIYGDPNEDPDANTSTGHAFNLIQSKHKFVLVGNTGRLGDVFPPFPMHDIFLSFMNSSGLVQQSLSIKTEAQFKGLRVVGADTTANKGIIIAGTTGNDPFLLKLDSLGIPEWNRTYNDVMGSLSNDLTFYNVISTPDVGYLAMGHRGVNGINSPFRLNGLVIKLNHLGLVQWSIDLAFPSSLQSDLIFANAANTPDGGYVITGGGGSSAQQTSSFVILKLDTAGNVQWSNGEYGLAGDASGISEVVTTTDGGYAISGFRGPFDNRFYTLMKLDSLGNSSCEGTANLSHNSFDIFLDTFTTQSTILIDTLVQKEVIITDYDGFIKPFMPDSLTFCEGDILTLQAPFLGAVSYEWSTGETTDSITVTEAGTYTVNVRVEDDFCFNICDTVFVSTISPPSMLQIADLGDFCTNNFTTLSAELEGNIDSLVWSTGETTPTIEVATAGLYTAMVFHECGVVEASIEVQAAPPTVNINSTGDFCIDGTALLSLNIQGSVDSIIWNTGENTPMIEVSEIGTYSVMVFNQCGFEEASFIIEETLPTVSIEEQGDVCIDGATTLLANSAFENSILWSTGATTPSIEVMSPGMYSVTVSNECGTATSSTEVAEVLPTVSINTIYDSLCLTGQSLFTFTAEHETGFMWSDSSTNNTLVISESGAYHITVTNKCGTTSASFEVETILPEVTIMEIDSLCLGSVGSLSFEAKNATSFVWTLPDGSTNSMDETLVITEEGDYSIMVRNECGEMEEASYSVDCVFKDCVQIPNVFTPNGDRTNDEFFPVIKSECNNVITIQDMRIYNRWGQLVFESTTGEAWDGQMDGKLAPSDVYIYYVDYLNSSPEKGDGMEVLKGDVTLVR